MRHFPYVSLFLALTIPYHAVRAEPGPFSAVMTSAAAPTRRALLVIPSTASGMYLRGALAASDANAYRDTLRLLGFSGAVVAAETRQGLRDAARTFAASVPRDAEVAIFVLGSVIPAGGKLYVPASDLPSVDRTAERIATAAIDLSEILRNVVERGPKDVVVLVDECGNGEAKPSCDVMSGSVPDGVSAIVVRRVPAGADGPVAGVATVRQDLLPLMREPDLDYLQLYGRLKTKLQGTNDGLTATAALSRSFAFLPGDFLSKLPVECNRVDPTADADALRRAPSVGPLVLACERAATTYDFTPYFKTKLTAAREQFAFQKAVASCTGNPGASYLEAYPGGAYRFAVAERASECERAARSLQSSVQTGPSIGAPASQTQSTDETTKSQPKRIYVIDRIPGNVLYLRDGPGSHYTSLAAMISGTDDLYTEGECRKGDPSDKWLWCQVAWRGLSGWASACCFAPKALFTTNNRMTGIFEVPDDIPGGVLNLRRSASYGSALVTSIPAGAKTLLVGQCQMPLDGKGRPYCHVRWQEFDGWASSYYLQPSADTQTGSRP